MPEGIVCVGFNLVLGLVESRFLGCEPGMGSSITTSSRPPCTLAYLPYTTSLPTSLLGALTAALH